MSPPGRPKGEFRRAKPEARVAIPPSRPKGEFRRAKPEGRPVSTPDRFQARIPQRAARRVVQ